MWVEENGVMKERERESAGQGRIEWNENKRGGKGRECGGQDRGGPAWVLYGCAHMGLTVYITHVALMGLLSGEKPKSYHLNGMGPSPQGK